MKFKKFLIHKSEYILIKNNEGARYTEKNFPLKTYRVLNEVFYILLKFVAY